MTDVTTHFKVDTSDGLVEVPFFGSSVSSSWSASHLEEDEEQLLAFSLSKKLLREDLCSKQTISY